jgi:hypothetical protein
MITIYFLRGCYHTISIFKEIFSIFHILCFLNTNITIWTATYLSSNITSCNFKYLLINGSLFEILTLAMSKLIGKIINLV